jgi:ABC-type lipoprotein export system ATPase subunit
MKLIRLHDVTKTYSLGEVSVPVLKGVSLEVGRGEMVALMGASGSGKSTLMNILGCLDRPTSGEYWLDGQEISNASGDERALIRNRKIGFVFQSFNLLARTSALDNVIMPLAYNNSLLSNREARALGRAMLERVGLGERMGHQPSQLSGGQQQRVAIARALINSPQIVFADEPTGNLDSKTSKEILRMFQDLSEQDGITVVLVTHDPGVAHAARRVIRISDGLIAEGIYDDQVAEPDPAAA